MIGFGQRNSRLQPGTIIRCTDRSHRSTIHHRVAHFLHGFRNLPVYRAAKQRRFYPTVVYDPGKNELFTATRGRGAFLHDKRLRSHQNAIIWQTSLIGTGFPYTKFEHWIVHGDFPRADAKNRWLRRPGWPADLAWTAPDAMMVFF